MRTAGRSAGVPVRHLPDLVGGLFPLDEAECEKIAAGTLATCQEAVSAEVPCWKQVIKGLAKGGKVGGGA